MDLLLLIPLRIIMGAAFALLYKTVGTFKYPWLQAMGSQCCSYCISCCIELQHRSKYKRRKKQEAARASEAEAKLQQLLAKEGIGAAASTPQVRG